MLICIYLFQFGDSQKLRLVRILRSTVMVRVGGGWVALEEFLQKNDPCRGKFCKTLNKLKSPFIRLLSWKIFDLRLTFNLFLIYYFGQEKLHKMQMKLN